MRIVIEDLLLKNYSREITIMSRPEVTGHAG
jgi:hypothetical protein